MDPTNNFAAALKVADWRELAMMAADAQSALQVATQDDEKPARLICLPRWRSQQARSRSDTPRSVSSGGSLMPTHHVHNQMRTRPTGTAGKAPPPWLDQLCLVFVRYDEADVLGAMCRHRDHEPFPRWIRWLERAFGVWQATHLELSPGCLACSRALAALPCSGTGES